MSRRLGSCVLALVALLITGCKQNEGGRCEISSDCGPGLICDNPTQTSGVCVSTAPSPARDAAVAVPADGSADTTGTVLPDGAPPDQASDAAATDASTPDAAADVGMTDGPADSAASDS